VDLNVSGPRGKVTVTDFGDLVRIKETRWLIKGRHLNVVFHIGKISDTTPADRVRGPGGTPSPSQKVDGVMDLPADKKIVFNQPTFTDELEHPVPAPDNYTVDAPDILNVTDNGDGTAVVASTGELGSAILHLEITGDVNATGDELINVVAGNAERVKMNPGEISEVTPDV
jgi:hypothetical protein